MSAWIRSPSPPANADPSGLVHRFHNFEINWNHTDFSDRGAILTRVSGSWFSASFGALTGDTWYHLVGTYDGNVLRAYKNGILSDSNTGPSGPSDTESNSLKFGRHADLENYFEGDVMDVRLYNRALSSGEVGALYDTL